jgi:hypothetical protein
MYKDFIIQFLFNYSFCALTFTLLSRKFVWYPPLFISILLMSIRIICFKYTHDMGWSFLISIVLTAYLYIRVFIPITYPKEKVIHEQNVSE